MDKEAILSLAREHVCPGKIATFGQIGVDLVIGRREGPYIHDVSGERYIDLHINGGTFNLGHRNPELIAVLTEALTEVDIGNHHFASKARAELAAQLAEHAPGNMPYTVFAASGSEANDIAIKTARWATGRRTVVSLDKGYYGSTGLSGAVGNNDNARFFLSEGLESDYIRVPFNDLDAMEQALSDGSVAAVIMETIPATLGFPIPGEGYLSGVLDLCRRFGALYIADEVQTGLGRTGNLWGVETFGVAPDILVTGKGLSGGLYPIAATVMTDACGGWLTEKGFAHISTFGGAEPGCRVASKVLSICADRKLLASVRKHAGLLGDGLRDLSARYPFLKEVRQCGLVIGLQFDHPIGAALMCRELYRNGIWAMVAGFDYSVLQFKPYLYIDESLVDEILTRLEAALKSCPTQL